MRDLTQNQKQSLAPHTSTLCWAWRLQRKDGLLLGFTDHDKPIEIDGLVYEPHNGFDGGVFEQDIGFSINSAQINSVFSSDAITEDDLRSGLYDAAEIDLFRLDWMAPSEPIHMSHWVFGDVQFGKSGFEVELVGRASKLDRSTGRVFSRHCDAEFGDSRCQINSDDFPSGTVCPRTLSACRDQFNNVLNFRGFPYLLGDDALTRSPQVGEVLDGGSRFK